MAQNEPRLFSFLQKWHYLNRNLLIAQDLQWHYLNRNRWHYYSEMVGTIWTEIAKIGTMYVSNINTPSKINFMKPMLILPRNESEAELLSTILSKMNIDYWIVENNPNEDLLFERLKVFIASEFAKNKTFSKKREVGNPFGGFTQALGSLFDDNENAQKLNYLLRNHIKVFRF